MTPRELMRDAPVIPVIVIDRVADAVPLARALCAGGIRVLEITLRTQTAMDAVRAIAAEVPEAIVGVGTVVRPAQFDEAVRAGARFAVSPGFTIELGRAARSAAVPLLPGVMTPSDVVAALGEDYSELKFFPAQQAGGIPMLKALNGPFPEVKFCPTGGITPDTAASFLALPNVVCVGGSWLVPKALVDRQDWSAITALARDAAAYARP